MKSCWDVITLFWQQIIYLFTLYLKVDKHHLCEKWPIFFQLTGAKAYVKPSLEMHVLQSLQGQFSGFHFLILFRNTDLNLVSFCNYQEEYPR